MPEADVEPQMERTLSGARPAPPRSLREGLRGQLLAQRPGRHRPARLWAMAITALVAGGALLAAAALYAL